MTYLFNLEGEESIEENKDDQNRSSFSNQLEDFFGELSDIFVQDDITNADISMQLFGPEGSSYRIGPGSVLHRAYKIMAKMKELKTRNRKTWSERERKDMQKSLNAFKVKLGRKIGNFISMGEDWPIVLLFTLTLTDAQAKEVLEKFNSYDGTKNGYERFAQLVGYETNSVVDVVMNLKRVFSFKGMGEDIIDEFLATLYAYFQN